MQVWTFALPADGTLFRMGQCVEPGLERVGDRDFRVWYATFTTS
jgi:hypothetical protein